MKVRARFPTACRAEQTVHAPPEPPGGQDTAPLPGAAPAVVRERPPSSAAMRRGRAFPTTRPHQPPRPPPGGPASRHGIGP